MRKKWGIPILLFSLLFFTLSPAAGIASDRYRPGSLYQTFQQAADEFEVPVEILLAVSYVETRWQDHKGKPSQLNGYGLMHLADNPSNQSLKEASRLLGIPESTLKKNIKQNIRGGAAVLAKRAKKHNGGTSPNNLADWYVPVAEYSGLSSEIAAKWYADEVFKVINQGAQRVIDGEDLFIPPTPVTPHKGKYEDAEKSMEKQATPDYPGARWVPASSSNYTVANRESDGNSIDYVIIHTTQGSYSGTISWFQNPSSKVSAHYVIRSSDGEITQMVQNKDIAWHAGNWNYNVHSIGIEHEGYVSDPAWYTDAMYRASANLTRWLCDRYGIPKNRNHIIGHNEVPGATHTDPGPHWDWNYYMSLVNQSEEFVFDNTGPHLASDAWGTSSWNSQKYGSNYRFAEPLLASDPFWYQITVPSSGSYDIYGWWPANSGYNSRTPVVIKTTSGYQTVYVNQQLNGGKWNYLGRFNLSQGTDYFIGVSRWTSTPGYVVADAFKLIKR
ncbi:MAG: N-acetylmuramoyl-L-alanine amidase [Planifilum fulgidum]